MAIKYFKVKYGYSQADQVSITENDLDRAILAQREGVVVQLGSASINGRNIISITPHYHKYTGWYDWYEPKDGEDFTQIKRDCPNFDGIIEKHKEYVEELSKNNQLKQIGNRDWENEPELEKIEKPKNQVSEMAKELSNKFSIK